LVLSTPKKRSVWSDKPPWRGYRFAADVQEVAIHRGRDEPQQITARVPAPVVPRPAKQHFAQPLLWLSAALALLIAGGSYVAWKSFRHRERTAASRILLAVLRFENLTGESAQDYLSEGLTEEMITELGRVDPQSLGVIARTSVLRYKNGSDLGRVARELGVDYLLEGSVRRDSEKVRITAQLIQTRDQTHVWARQYDRQLTSLLALQDEIAQEIGDEIELMLGGDHKPVVADRGAGHAPGACPRPLSTCNSVFRTLGAWFERSNIGRDIYTARTREKDSPQAVELGSLPSKDFRCRSSPLQHG